MVHDPVEQAHEKYNSFLSSMFILGAGASGNETLILLLYGVSHKKGIDKKTFIWSCSRPQFTVFKFIWI